MKNLKKLILLAGVVAMSACAKEKLVNGSVAEPDSLTECVLDFSMPDSQTKTALGTKTGTNYPVVWKAGDVVTLNGVLSSAVPAADDGKNTTSLVVKADSQAPYNVLYPGVEGVSDKVVFPTEQAYTAGTFAADALPMYASASTLVNGFDMQYLGAVLSIPVKFLQKATVTRLVLTAVGNEGLSGEFAVGKTSGALNGNLSATEASPSVTLTFGAAGTEFAANSTPVFYVALPKGTYSKGLEMKVYDIDGNFMKASLFSDINTVQAGKVYEFEVRNYTQDGTAYFISDVADLQNFAIAKSGEKWMLLEAMLTADINMTGKEYDADAFNFYGTLDGAGHTITGLTKPLFNNLHGSVKNITLESNITEAVGSGANSYGLGMLCRYAYAPTEEESGDFGQVIDNVTTKGSINVTHTTTVDFALGGIVGSAKGVPMTNCENQASITADISSSSSAVRVAGVCALAHAPGVSLTACVNKGDVTSTGRLSQIAGVVAYYKQAGVMTSCENYGKITSTAVPSSPVYLGGVVGQKDKVRLDLASCKNDGDVTLECGDHDKAVFMAGVIAGCPGYSSVITDCSNSGNISNNSPATTYVDGTNHTAAATVGGIIGRITDSAIGTISGCTNTGDITNSCAAVDARLGGILAYTHQKVGGIKACVNEGKIENKSIADSSYVHVGGIVGFANATCPISEQTTNKGIVKNSSADPVAIINPSATDDNVRLGGIIGSYSSTSNSQCTDCVNEGAIINASTSGIGWLCMGGIIGADNGSFTIQRAENKSAVTNDGVIREEARIGGIAGYATAYLKIDGPSVNSGNVTVNGTVNGVVYAAGVLGYDNNAGGSSVITATNSGAVTCTVPATKDLELAGVVADLNGTATNCSNSGEISTTANVGASLYIGGVVGYTTNNKAMTNLTNTGNVRANGITIKNQLWAGGVCGAEKNSVTMTHENLVNKGRVVFETIESSDTHYSYVGGVSGANGSTKATYKNCSNEGRVYYKGKQKVRLGGLVSYASVCPVDCWVKADVQYVCTAGGSAKSDVGGVVGYLNVASISGLTYKGILSTQGSSPRAYTGCIVGNQNNTKCTFSNCKVGGQIIGVSEYGDHTGLICCTQTKHEVNFVDCIIETGTKHGTAAVTELFLNNSANKVRGALCGGLFSTGTMENCTIGSIE